MGGGRLWAPAKASASQGRAILKYSIHGAHLWMKAVGGRCMQGPYVLMEGKHCLRLLIPLPEVSKARIPLPHGELNPGALPTAPPQQRKIPPAWP